MTDAELIAEFIATRGVTRCPPAAVAPTTADVQPVPDEDRSGEARRHRNRFKKRNRAKHWQRQIGGLNSVKSRRRKQ